MRKAHTSKDERITERIKIEKHIPIPPVSSERLSKYRWKEMKVGDSFFVACTSTEKGATSKLQCSLYTKGAKQFRVTTRVRTEDGKLGVRIWRIAEKP